MRKLYFGLLTIFPLCFMVGIAKAAEGDIQLLPPTLATGEKTVCTYGSNNFLTMGGSGTEFGYSALTCVTNATLDPLGNAYFAGMVGIGTQTPAGELDVEGTGNVILNAGRVGIGTTSPSHILDIETATPEVGGSNDPANFTNSNPGGRAIHQATNDVGAFAQIEAMGSDYVIPQYRNEGVVGAANDFMIVPDGSIPGGGSHSIFMITGGYMDNPTITVTAGNPGAVGIGTMSPQATLDVQGYVHLVRYSSPPTACGPATDGNIALTQLSTLCVCNGASSNWVKSSDGVSACSW